MFNYKVGVIFPKNSNIDVVLHQTKYYLGLKTNYEEIKDIIVKIFNMDNFTEIKKSIENIYIINFVEDLEIFKAIYDCSTEDELPKKYSDISKCITTEKRIVREHYLKIYYKNCLYQNKVYSVLELKNIISAYKEALYTDNSQIMMNIIKKFDDELVDIEDDLIINYYKEKLISSLRHDVVFVENEFNNYYSCLDNTNIDKSKKYIKIKKEIK